MHVDVKGVNSGISDTCSREKGLEYLIHVYTCERGSGISDTCSCERGLEFLIYVDLKGVLKFLVNTSWYGSWYSLDGACSLIKCVLCLLCFQLKQYI